MRGKTAEAAGPHPALGATFSHWEKGSLVSPGPALHANRKRFYLRAEGATLAIAGSPAVLPALRAVDISRRAFP